MKVAIIGSGPGGSIVAATLKRNNIDFAIYEKGSYFNQHSITPFSKEELLNKYNGVGVTVAFGNPKVKFAEGKCFGGGSEVNAGLYHKLPADLINKWSKEYQIDNFNEDSLKGYFQSTSEAVNVSFYKGDIPKTSTKLEKGANLLGWSVLEVPRWFKFDLGQNGAGGVRQSMTETYLTESLRKQVINLEVVEIKKQKDKWFIKTNCGNQLEYDAVFLCAGAIETPRLLKKSKLSKNAGQTLYMHPSLKVVAEFDEEINDLSPNIGVHQVKEFSPLISFGCSISTPEYISLALAENGYRCDDLSRYRNMAIYYTMLNSGKGRVRNIPLFNNPYVSYSLSDSELNTLYQSIENLCRVLFSSGAKSVYPGLSNIGKVNSLEELIRLKSYFKREYLNLMTIHIMGSCPFGENEKITVADSYGQVHGHRNLFIADSSMMCSGLGVNPQGTVMALASRVVEKFCSNHKPKE